MFRNKETNLYLTAVDINYTNQSNVLIDSLSFSKKQVFNYDNYSYSNSLRTCNVFTPIDNNMKAIDVSGASTSNGANIQIYDKNSTDAQYFSINSIQNNSNYSNTGSYKISTCVTNYEKAISCQDYATTIGTNLCQWEYENNQAQQWVIDGFKNVMIDWKNPNTQSNYVQKNQYLYYKLNITISGNYTIQTYSNFDTYMELFDETLTLINSNDDEGESLNSRIIYNFNSGVYFLKIRMYSSQVEGKVNTIIAKTNNIPQTAIGTTNQQISLGNYDARYYKLSKDQINDVYNIYTTGGYDTFIGIYDDCFNFIGSNDDDGDNNNAFYSYTFNSNSPIFILVRMFNGSTSGDITFVINHPHTHNYIYSWVDYTQHRKSCICGVTGLQPHIVSSGAFNNGQQYAECTLCHGQAYIGSIYNKGSNHSFPTTFNGSFILPNGVIVLEDEDMDAYLDGSLVFNYPNSGLSNSRASIPQYLKKKEKLFV